MEVTADYTFTDVRSLFHVLRLSNILCFMVFHFNTKLERQTFTRICLILNLIIFKLKFRKFGWFTFPKDLLSLRLSLLQMRLTEFTRFSQSEVCGGVWSQISNIESIIAMPFLAMKMDSSFLYLSTTTMRTIKNRKFTKNIWTMFRALAIHIRFLGFPLLVSVSAICQGESNKLKQATAIIATPNAFGIP